GLRWPGHKAVEHVEEHGRDDAPRAVAEVAGRVLPLAAVDPAGDDDGREAADGVAQREQRRQDGDLLHGAAPHTGAWSFYPFSGRPRGGAFANAPPRGRPLNGQTYFTGT